MEYSEDPTHFDHRSYYQNMEREDWSQSNSEYANSYDINDDSQGNNTVENNNNFGSYSLDNDSHQNIYNYSNDQDNFHHFICPLT